MARMPSTTQPPSAQVCSGAHRALRHTRQGWHRGSLSVAGSIVQRVRLLFWEVWPKRWSVREEQTVLYMAKGRDQAGSYQTHYSSQPNYHLCHILGQRGPVNNGLSGERPEQETDRLWGGVGRDGKHRCSGTGQGQSPRVKPGSC